MLRSCSFQRTVLFSTEEIRDQRGFVGLPARVSYVYVSFI